jgi:type III restriction enzyme
MQEIKQFNTQDLVLKVSHNYDLSKLDFKQWSTFLDILCGDREYQKIAIRETIIYLASGKYASIEDLVKENFTHKNPKLLERYKDLQEYYRKIQLPQKLSATVDLATGTGKSYVMYGIAQIALGIGLVDRVLVLCPSLTIEKGLTEKFFDLSSSEALKNTLPDVAVLRNPSIINATRTIKVGDICIENIHAVYANNGSSIQDSLGFGKGQTCLVLNDEAHHIYNKVTGNDKESQVLKKWREFLLDGGYGFRYMLGFTGTAYIDNEYFNDVIFRYSLNIAMEDRVVKGVIYVAKDEDGNNLNVKMQKVWQNHEKTKAQYSKIKPLTILITNNIINAKRLEREAYEFLAEKELNIKVGEHQEGTAEEREQLERLRRKILIVTSDKEHRQNVERLSEVDDKTNLTEWIVSVSMLTEGWDVKNVFQIVPMDERAFNSKLLIAQVLGRGLRLPEMYSMAQVTVFNHDSWSIKIQSLVDEILEIQMRLISSPIREGERAKYHFTLYNINYEKTFDTIPTTETKTFDYTKDYIEFTAQVDKYETSTQYVSIKGDFRETSYEIEKEMFSVESIVSKIYEEFKIREWEGVTLKLKDGEYTKNNLPPKEALERIIRNSMSKRGITGDYLDKKNRQAVFSAFNTLLRKKPKTMIPKRLVNEPYLISTTSKERESVFVGNLRKEATVSYSMDYENEIINEDTKTVLEQVIEDQTFPRSSVKDYNTSVFKTAFDLVFTVSEPERKFVELLCKNFSHLDKWIKSKNQSFYSIEYAIQMEGGNRSKQAQFNPDFFLVVAKNGVEYVVVVEIKGDELIAKIAGNPEGDDAKENKAKFRYAKQHFRDLNMELGKMGVQQQYIFHFLTQSHFNEFFSYLQSGKLIEPEEPFQSEIETLLKK